MSFDVLHYFASFPEMVWVSWVIVIFSEDAQKTFGPQQYES